MKLPDYITADEVKISGFTFQGNNEENIPIEDEIWDSGPMSENPAEEEDIGESIGVRTISRGWYPSAHILITANSVTVLG